MRRRRLRQEGLQLQGHVSALYAVISSSLLLGPFTLTTLLLRLYTTPFAARVLLHFA